MSTTKLAALEEFKNELESSNRVSKSMVLSLEEYVGDPVVTSTINPNKLTTAPTPTLTEEVNALVEKAIEKEKNESIEDALTPEDIVGALNSKVVTSALQTIISCAYSYNWENPFKESVLIAAMTDDSIKYRYVADVVSPATGGQIEELTDITKLEIAELVAKYKNYFRDVRKILFGEQLVDSKEFPDIPADELTSFDPIANALLNLIDTDSLYMAVNKQPKSLTIRDICEIVSNRSMLSDKIQDIIELAGKYSNINSDYDNDVEARALAEAFIKLKPSADRQRWLIADIMRFMFISV